MLRHQTALGLSVGRAAALPLRTPPLPREGQ